MCIFFVCTAKHFFNKISLYSTKNTWYIKDSYPVVASRYLCIFEVKEYYDFLAPRWNPVFPLFNLSRLK